MSDKFEDFIFFGPKPMSRSEKLEFWDGEVREIRQQLILSAKVIADEQNWASKLRKKLVEAQTELDYWKKQNENTN